jgi:hypothetical protein
MGRILIQEYLDFALDVALNVSPTVSGRAAKNEKT